MSNISIGRLGEDIAEEHLKTLRYKVIERNYRSGRWGEIDIVAIEDKTTVFVEVKTRLSTDYGEPQEAVTKHKIEALKRTGYYYKILHPETPEALRIDVVAVTLDETTQKPLKILVFKDAR